MHYFLQFLVDTFGYHTALRIKDYLADFSWFFMGFYATMWFHAWLLRRVTLDDEINEYVEYMYVKISEEKSFFIYPPKSFLDMLAIQPTLVKTLLSRKSPPPFKLKNHKRRRRIVGVFLTIFTLFAIYGFLAGMYVILPDCKKHPELGDRCHEVKVEVDGSVK